MTAPLVALAFFASALPAYLFGVLVGQRLERRSRTAQVDELAIHVLDLTSLKHTGPRFDKRRPPTQMRN